MKSYINTNKDFARACEECTHEEFILVDGELYQIYFGPEHDSWAKVESRIKIVELKP